MSIFPRLLTLVLLLSLVLPAQDELTQEGREAAATLAHAGWSGSVNSGSVKFTVRLAPVCTEAMRNALAHMEDLDAQAQRAFPKWAKVEFLESGWFFKVKVQKGSYDIGLSLVHGQPMLTLRQGGKALGLEPFWFQGEVLAHPKAEIQERGGASVLRVSFDNIRLSYRFISDAAHAALIRPLKVYGEGRVKIRSDLGRHRELRDLAAWLDKAVVGSENFLVGTSGRQEYELCLFATRKGYQDMDRLMTGGSFARNWAFTSNQSRISYIWYHPHSEPEALAHHGMPLRLQTLSLHELQHALSYKSLPLLLESIPPWFSEALAERGVHAGLASVDKSLAKKLHQRHVDRLAFARLDTCLPAFQDLWDWKTEGQMSELYSAAYLFSYRAVPKIVKDLPALLARISDAGFTHEALHVLRDRGFDAAAYHKALPSGKPRQPLRLLGDFDVVGKSLRLISSVEGQGRILLPQRASKDHLQVKGSFSWQELGSKQVDLYLGYRRGLRSAEFLKLALMPNRVVLFSYRAGTWFRVAIKDYDETLAVGTAKERAWHSFSVDLDAQKKELELTIGESRRASLTLPGSVDLAGTRVALGVYDGIAWFRSVTIR